MQICNNQHVYKIVVLRQIARRIRMFDKRKKQVLIFAVLVLFSCFPLMAQRDYLNIPRESAMSTATFNIFTNEYDMFDDPLYWMETKPKVFDMYNGITDESYLLGFARDFENIYFQGAYFGLFPTYGHWWTMLTNFDLNFLLGFNDTWSFKFQYFDQNYSTGQGSILPEFIVGLKMPMQENTLRTSISFAPAMHWSSGLRLDYIQPEFIVTLDYETPKNQVFGLIQSLMFTVDGPNKNNGIDPTGAPIRSQTTIRYNNAWNVTSIAEVGIEPVFTIEINPFNFPEKGQTYDGVTIPMKDALNFFIGIPSAMTIELIPNRFSFYTGFILGMFFANYSYVSESETGGNYYGWIPVSGFGLGMSLIIDDSIHFQIGSQLAFVPEITEGRQPTYYKNELTLLNFLNAPLSISVTVGK